MGGIIQTILSLIFIQLTLFTPPLLSQGDACSFGIIECECEHINGAISIDCSNRGLTEFPQFEGAKFQANNIDLSNNLLKEFPQNLYEFPMLKTLDLSNNQIGHISGSALEGCNLLQFLYLGYNNISNWIDINPNSLLKPATTLEALVLTGNPLSSFNDIDESLLLMSSSLKLLDLSNCLLTKITDRVLLGLTKLEHLILSDNPIRILGNFISSTLRMLILSNCKLSYLRPTIFSKLPSLTYVSLAKNHRLSLDRPNNQTIRSDSIKQLDLSYCNMDEIQIQSFPNLVVAILKGNLINQLNRQTFESTPNLQKIDLSYNAITDVGSGSFRDLKYLKSLDLSFNMVRRIERDTFKHNSYLTDINLSRNFIDKFNRFTAKSLTYLNMSWCEIISIEIDAFAEMPELIQLDLSNNLFTHFPVSLRSDSLQTLDLGRCRLTTIRNETFQGFPELSNLNLAGNRFTVPFRRDYFSDNPYLRDIWLGDNPWRCDCSASGFHDFYIYLTEHPTKVNDRGHLRCFSPDELYGSLWEVACFNIWYTNNVHVSVTQKIWTFLMVVIVVSAGGICMFMSIKRYIESKRLEREEREMQRNMEEVREIARQNRLRLEQEAQLNAPDPRESRPPCYADAILLPRIDGTYYSLEDLSIKRGKRRRKDKSFDESDNEITIASRRNRSRSENVLSTGEQILTTVTDAILNRNQHDTVNTTNNSRRSPNFPSRTFSPSQQVRIIAEPELHYLATDILALPQNMIDAHRSVERNQSIRSQATDLSDDLVEDIQNFEHANSSPYAQRKLPSLNKKESSSEEEGGICIVENHYRPNESSNSSRSDDDMGFGSFTVDELTNLRRQQ